MMINGCHKEGGGKLLSHACMLRNSGTTCCFEQLSTLLGAELVQSYQAWPSTHAGSGTGHKQGCALHSTAPHVYRCRS